jgi:dipeptidyl aminopeptidase/acylaminoacyl peptidase
MMGVVLGRLTTLVVPACLLIALGCSATEPPEPDPSPLPTAAGEPRQAMPTTEPEPDPPHPVSLPALFDADFDGGDLEVGNVLDQAGAYTRYGITYSSGDLTVSGIMNVPAGDGPFPVLVLAHGYIDPDIYTTGRGLAREQDYLARQGYVVLHTDYRNHAGSDDDPDNEVRLRLGYTDDVINAVLAVRESDLPYLHGDRVGLLGRSMGGGVAYNVLVTMPGLVDAAVVYAPVSSDTVDNFDRWTRGNPESAGLTAEVIDAYGAPEDEPDFWRGVSSRTFFDRITEPILIHHGTADDTTPIEWSYETMDALDDAGVDAEFIEYDGEPHAFEAAWPDSIERSAAFFDTHLGS